MKKKILIFNRFFLPGQKSGGPINSINNIINKVLKSNIDKFDVYLICKDRDFLDEKKYPDIKQNKINNSYGIKIIYVSNLFYLAFWTIKLRNINKFYFNSFFDLSFSIIPFFIIKFLSKETIIINSRGELSKQSLKIKKIKKYIYLYISKLFQFYRKCIFQVTDNSETMNIEKFISKKIVVITNLIANDKTEIKKNLDKEHLKLIYFSRITKKKNLLETLKILKKFNRQYSLDIYGVIDDNNYWNECKVEIDKINFEKQKISFMGTFEKSNLQLILKNYHYSILLTAHENFGHSIIDSILNFTPVITTKNVYWAELEKYNLGWNINDINNHDNLLKVLSICDKNKNNINYNAYKNNLKKYLNVYYKEDQLISKYLDLFSA